jgi:hypothetical protein
LLHVDDRVRLNTWRDWLQHKHPLLAEQTSENEARLRRMLLTQLLNQVSGGNRSLTDGATLLWEHPQIVRELRELFDVLTARINHVTLPLSPLPDVPLQVHARYTRLEILSACGIGTGTHIPSWQSGVYYTSDINTDLLAFTLDKTKGQFSPTTRYRDYAVSRELIHWESQSVTRADGETGKRYQDHEARGGHVLLFTRRSTAERAFYFLGPATYESHIGERPMAVTWRLRHSLPGDLFQEFAAAVA